MLGGVEAGAGLLGQSPAIRLCPIYHREHQVFLLQQDDVRF